MTSFISAAASVQTLSLAAMEEASRRGLRNADLEHLFLALVINDQAAGRALRKAGITLDGARSAVDAMHSDQLRSVSRQIGPIRGGSCSTRRAGTSGRRAR
ncbi:Clp protease N-terminal domain-containing protein [Arthrobacter sp. Hz1]